MEKEREQYFKDLEDVLQNLEKEVQKEENRYAKVIMIISGKCTELILKTFHSNIQLIKYINITSFFVLSGPK